LRPSTNCYKLSEVFLRIVNRSPATREVLSTGTPSRGSRVGRMREVTRWKRSPCSASVSQRPWESWRGWCWAGSAAPWIIPRPRPTGSAPPVETSLSAAVPCSSWACCVSHTSRGDRYGDQEKASPCSKDRVHHRVGVRRLEKAVQDHGLSSSGDSPDPCPARRGGPSGTRRVPALRRRYDLSTT